MHKETYINAKHKNLCCVLILTKLQPSADSNNMLDDLIYGYS